MLQLNDILKYFADSELYYNDLLLASLQPNVVDTNRKTAKMENGIVIPIRGTADFGLNGESYPLKKGMILHAGKSMELNVLAKNEVFEYIVLHYQGRDGLALSNEAFCFPIGENHEIDYLVQQLISNDEIPGSLNRIKCRSLFLQIVERILISAKMQSINNHVDQAIQYMRENYHQPISIGDVADSVQCERRKLAYLFDKQIGLSPIQFLTELRLKHAQKLLRTTTIPVKAIAELVGYQDSFYFCRVFKKLHEMTPTMYRQQKM